MGSFIALAKGNRSKAVTQVHIHTYIHTYIHAYIHTYMHTYIHTVHTVSQNPPFINLFQYRHARLIKDSTSDPSEVRTIFCTNNTNTYNIYHYIHTQTNIHRDIHAYIHTYILRDKHT